MNITEICIRRPVLASVLSLILILLGCLVFPKISLTELPKVESPIIKIKTELPGAGPRTILDQITRPLEDGLAKLEGIEFFQSESSAGESEIIVTIRNNFDMEKVINDVRDVISKERINMPTNIQGPVIKRARRDDTPLLLFGIAGKDKNLDRLSDYVNRFLISSLEAIPGVAGASLNNKNKTRLIVRLDPIKLAAYHLTVGDVYDAINSQNFINSAGKIENNQRIYNITISAEITELNKFGELIVGNYHDSQVRLANVAEIELANPSSNEEIASVNGQPMLLLTITGQSNANPVEVAAEVKKRVKELEKILPTGSTINLVLDYTSFISQSLDDVWQSIYEAIVLVSLIVFLFLWSWKAALVPLATIPVSLLGGIIFIYFFGFTQNRLTLLALVLAVGLVVDDAIVVLENIHAKLEKGLKPIDAAIIGSRDISFSIIAMTLTLAAVYIPIGFSHGKIGLMFKEFAFTLAGSVLVSGFVALTLSPMMCSKLLNNHLPEQKNYFFFLENFLVNFLTSIWNFRIIFLIVNLLLAGGGIFFGLKSLPREASPKEDRGYIVIYSEPFVGLSNGFINRYLDKMDALIAEENFVVNRFIDLSSGRIKSYVFLEQWKNRSKDSQSLANILADKFHKIPGVSFRFKAKSSSFSSENNIEIVLFGTKNAKELEEYRKILIKTIQEQNLSSGKIWVEGGQDLDTYKIVIDKERVAASGVEINAISSSISLLQGLKPGVFNYHGLQYDISLTVPQQYKNSLDFLRKLYVRSQKQKNDLIPVYELVKIVRDQEQQSLENFNKLPAFFFSFEPNEKKGIGEVINQVRQLADKVLPNEVMMDYIGMARDFLDSDSESKNLFLLALLFIFLILAAQFESFIDPFIILTSVPFAVSGAFLGLFLIEGGSLNIYSNIGIVTLIGLITKHGILLVDQANCLQDQGLLLKEAVIRAAANRLRPILMTTAAMILGSLPLLLATGAGWESRRQIGAVIVFGLAIGTLFTLFVVPCIYSYLNRRKKYV